MNLLEASIEAQKDYSHKIVLARVNGKLSELNREICESQKNEIEWVTTADTSGMQTYRRSATFLMLKAVRDVYGRSVNICVEYSLSKGYYCSVTGDVAVDETFIGKISYRMKELVDECVPINKLTYGLDEVIRIFHDEEMYDKEKLFRYRRASKVNLYEMDGFRDYFYGYMVPDTSYLTVWKLFLYDKGFVIQLPEKKEPEVVPAFAPQNKLFHVLDDSTKLVSKLGIENVGDLNDAIAGGQINELILVQEALQEKKIADIAEDIASRPEVKFVMIAGPSSSGKTTFSHRLSIQLRTQGLKPHPIGLDDYFVNRENTPKDEDGNYNFECLEALDIEQFNEDMTRLLAGEEVELPSFNFKTGRREYKGNFKKLGPDDILVIEGIHGLNDKLSHSLDKKNKYKIYISALTQLNIDEHNRIPTTDGRLIRRMVRDARTRGTTATGTIAMWDSVRRGEELNIFPYQETADAMFNSALLYELAVLKPYAEPALFGIRPEEPEYEEAKRLLKFLDYFLAVGSDELPKNSIIREFVGGSCFKV